MPTRTDPTVEQAVVAARAEPVKLFV
jgi:hypothetical protein